MINKVHVYVKCLALLPCAIMIPTALATDSGAVLKVELTA